MAQKNVVLHNGTGGSPATASAPSRKGPSFAAVLAVIAVIGILAGFAITKFKTGTGPQKNGDRPQIPEVPVTRPTAPEAQPTAPEAIVEEAPVAVSPQSVEQSQQVEVQRPVQGQPEPAKTGTGPEIAEDQEDEKPKRKSPFKSRTEVLLSMLNSVPPGVAPPPLPFSIDDDLEADADIGAEHVIEITEDDDEATATRKENVGWDKLDLQEMRKEGWTAAEFIKALENERNEDAAFRREKMQELERMLNDPEASDDDCYALYDELNKELAERGLPKLYMPVEGDDEDEEEEESPPDGNQ